MVCSRLVHYTPTPTPACPVPMRPLAPLSPGATLTWVVHAGTAHTATGNGTAFSSAGAGGAALLGRRALKNTAPPTGNIAASLNPSGPNCTERIVQPNGKGGGAVAQVSDYTVERKRDAVCTLCMPVAGAAPPGLMRWARHKNVPSSPPDPHSTLGTVAALTRRWFRAVLQGACSPAPSTSVSQPGDVSAAGPGGAYDRPIDSLQMQLTALDVRPDSGYMPA